MFLTFKKWGQNIKTAGYNDARTVVGMYQRRRKVKKSGGQQPNNNRIRVPFCSCSIFYSGKIWGRGNSPSDPHASETPGYYGLPIHESKNPRV